MKKNPFQLRRSLLSLSVSAAVSTIALGGLSFSANAQDDEDASSLEEIVVTGSRIVRRDYESNSPIVTVDSDDFEAQAGLNIESYLNQLPTYNPAASPVTTQGDVQITPVNSVGIASISLRGFGPNRSLVLVNGKRPTPINALMVTDINGVPSALVERVETITGGASAVYGADAVGGVTNFILRDNFEGLELDLQHGINPDAGDGDETRLSIVMGSNFADGRGNVTMGVEWYKRQEALQANRDIYTERWEDPRAAGSFFFLQGINGFNCVFDCPSTANVAALYGTTVADLYSPTANPAGFFAGYNFNPDGTIFITGNPVANAKISQQYIDSPAYALQTGLDNRDPLGQTTYDGVKWNNTLAYASAPQERYSFFASGNYDLTDNVRLFSRVNFAESKTRTLLFGTNAIFGWEATVPHDPLTDSPVDLTGVDLLDPVAVQDVINNPQNYPNAGYIPTGTAGAGHPVPVEMAILLAGRSGFGGPSPTANWQPNWNPNTSLPPRNTYNTNTVWQVEAGVDFDLPFKDWTGEAYFSHGESSTYNVAGGNLSLSRYRELINQPDYGRGASGQGNQDSARAGFGAGVYECTSGFYDTLFGGDVPLSEDCYNAVKADLQTRTQNQQDIIELNFQGGLFELPAGEVRTALGYQKRINKSQFNPDILQSRDSFTDQVIGVYPTGYLDASTSVDDFYVEALVPVLSDIPGIQMLELELGARFSDYSETDEETTWKALANWQINDWARLRGGFNRATRAPNIGELFLNEQEVFTGGGNFSDACAIRSNAPFGNQGAIIPETGLVLSENPTLDPGTRPPIALAPGQTQEGATSAYLICTELMGGYQTPAYEQFYVNSPAPVPGGGGGFAWVVQEGNSNLQSETADTWTFGAVIDSPWDNAWLSGLNASFDFYDVEIEDAIMLYSLDFAAYRCYGDTLVTSRAEAQAWVNDPTSGCALTPRESASTGGALSTNISYDNAATIKTSGMDVGVNWYGDLQDLFGWNGGLALSLNATILNEYKTKQSPANYDVETDWKGSLGPNLSGTNGGAYDFRLFGNIGYIRDNWSVSLRWRHLPEVWTAGYASQQAIIENNARVTAGAEGLILGYTPTTEIQTDSYNIFDLSFNYNINETFTLRGGITNLFDEAPPNVGSSAGRPPGTSLDACGSNPPPGCGNPGGQSLYSLGNFNGGYYDTNGRRMFLGIKAQF